MTSAFAVFWIPLIYLNFFLTFGLGIIMGSITGGAGKTGLVRNKLLMKVSGFVMGLVTVYVTWVIWIYALSEHEVLLFSPLELFSVITAVAENGVWSMFGFTPTGLFLYIIWAIEAGIIVFFSTTSAGAFSSCAKA